MGLSAQQLFSRGYYPTSNKYRMASRIDRPDWILQLAKQLHRTPAEFYIPGTDDTARWGEHYCRCNSKDNKTAADEHEWRELKRLWAPFTGPWFVENAEPIIQELMA